MSRWTTKLLEAGSNLLQVYRVSGASELFGLLLQMTNELARRAVFRWSGGITAERHWPAFCPELLLIRKYRDSPTGIARLESMRQGLNQSKTQDIRPGEIVALQDDAELEKIFRSLYQDQSLQLATHWLYKEDLMVRFSGAVAPSVTVIVPTRDRVDLLRKSVDAVLAAKAGSIELLIVDNGSTDEDTEKFLQTASEDSRCKVLRYPERFNWSKINNVAAAQSRSEVLVFLNNDIESANDDWLRNLTRLALAPGIGAVGPLLLYPDGTVQHAGVVVGMGRWAVHLYQGISPAGEEDLSTCFVSAGSMRQVTAVTGACMAVRRDTFEALGGFDERLEVIYGDIEFCVRAQRAGLRNLYAGHVHLVHHESKTRDASQIHVSDYREARGSLEPWRTRQFDPHYPSSLSRFSHLPRAIGPARSDD